MDYIKFNENYNNKLDDEIFTTLRLDDPERYQMGVVYNIICDGVEPFEAKIIKLRNFYDIEDIPIEIVKRDSGLETHEEFRKLIESFYGPNPHKFILITLRKV